MLDGHAGSAVKVIHVFTFVRLSPTCNFWKMRQLCKSWNYSSSLIFTECPSACAWITVAGSLIVFCMCMHVCNSFHDFVLLVVAILYSCCMLLILHTAHTESKTKQTNPDLNLNRLWMFLNVRQLLCVCCTTVAQAQPDACWYSGLLSDVICDTRSLAVL